MKSVFMILNLVALLGFFVMSPCLADSYKCQDHKGSISYSDRPCQEGHKQIAKSPGSPPLQLPTPSFGSLVSTEDLEGRWIDAPGQAYNSSWYFSGNIVTYANKQGVTMREWYTLTGDQLTFHHKPGIWGDTGWNESVTILQHTGQTLVLQWGVARVTLYRPI